MNDYVRISLETHLFFARIMKEHSFFLQAGFVSKDREWIRRADFFRRQFEDFLGKIVQMSNRMVSGNVLQSEEIVTCYTVDAERKTNNLTGIPINTMITTAERDLKCGSSNYQVTREAVQRIQRLNERAIWLLDGLIDFKERILNEVKECRMYTANYPLLIEHITREAHLYRDTIEGLMKNEKICYRNLQNQEEFWNCIMMEHAMFIRGLLDPSEPELMVTANDFVNDFRVLLDEARRKDCKVNNRENSECEKEERTLKKTMQLRDFKAAGTEGILNCQIKSVILPLLADHVLREANHYIRIQEHGYMWQEG